ncbi:hypothetical protein V6C16_04390, partial [Desulfovibrio sp. 1188_IL3213]|uniref:hypothetical protein n=1 Tax=Desulfovibrio sp. 1188_IL3213 TaxID=3084052 RepID=UPI002FDAE2A7
DSGCVETNRSLHMLSASVVSCVTTPEASVTSFVVTAEAALASLRGGGCSRSRQSNFSEIALAHSRFIFWPPHHFLPNSGPAVLQQSGFIPLPGLETLRPPPYSYGRTTVASGYGGVLRTL